MEELRKLELSDLDQMVSFRLMLQNYDLKYFDPDSTMVDQKQLEENTRQYFKENLDTNILMFGYLIDGKLVSNCGFYVESHFPTYHNPYGKSAYICNVYTEEAYRGKGYQKKVFEFCMAYAKDMGITRFSLDSLNEHAIQMYQSFGFQKDEHIYTYQFGKTKK